jgi:hypothetical protein
VHNIAQMRTSAKIASLTRFLAIGKLHQEDADSECGQQGIPSQSRTARQPQLAISLIKVREYASRTFDDRGLI